MEITPTQVSEPEAPEAAEPPVDALPQGEAGGGSGNELAQVWIAAFLVAMAGFMAYIGCWSIPLHGRDQALFQDSDALHRVQTCAGALKDVPNAPLTVFGLALNYQAVFGSVAGLHAVSLLFHLLNGVLLFLLLRRLIRGNVSNPVCMAAALCFVLNPFQASTVDMLAARPALQAVFFSLLATVLFLRAVEGESVRPGALTWAGVAFALAVGSHAGALVLPVLVFALDCCLSRARNHGYIHAAGVAVAAMLGAAYLASGSLDTAHLFKMDSLRSPLVYAAQAVLWLLVPLAFGCVGNKAARTVLGLVLAAVLLVAGVKTYVATLAFQEPEPYYAASGDAQSAYYLGRFCLHESERPSEEKARPEWLAKADAALKKARERGMDTAALWRSLGTVAMRLGKSDEAETCWKEVLHREPFDTLSAERLALCFEARMQKGADPETLRQALGYFRYAENAGSLSREGALHYATTLAGLGDAENSLARLQPFIGKDANTPLAPLVKQLEEAAARIQDLAKKSAEEMKSNPTGMGILLNRAEMELMRGEVLQASYLLDAALHRQADDARAWTLLGYARARMNEAPGFLAEWAQAPSSTQQAWRDLEMRCMASGLWEAAKTYAGAMAPVREGLASPETQLADIAAELKQPKLADQLLQQAADARPEDPAPWLKRCDLSIAAKDAPAASQALAEAEKRGAFPEEIEARRQQGGVAPAPAPGPVRNIIR